MESKVLIIDDDDVILLLHKNLVNKTDLDKSPFTFNKGDIALDYLQNNSQAAIRFLILLDINMSEFSGWDFLDHLSKHNYPSDIIVLIVSSSVSKSDKLKALGYQHVVGFIEKPLTKEALYKFKSDYYVD